jgi:hypothetical protein
MLAELNFHVIFINKKPSTVLPQPSPKADLTIRQHPFINKQMKPFSLTRREGKSLLQAFFKGTPRRETEFWREYLCQLHPHQPELVIEGTEGKETRTEIRKFIDFLLDSLHFLF